MHNSSGLNVLAGAIGLVLSGGAYAASTNIGVSTPGSADIFVTIFDNTTGAGLTFDTGVNAASFTGTSSLSFDLSSDTVYKSFKAQAGGTDTFNYSVLGGWQPSGTQDNVVYSAVSAGPAITGSKLAQSWTQLSTYVPQVNALTSVVGPPRTSDSSSTTAWSASTVNGGNGNAIWVSSNETTFNSALNIVDSALLGTALNFFTSTSSNLTNGLTKNVNPTAYLYTWNVSSAGLITYGQAVPLPAPVLLLLSGLGLMGVVARRKSAV